MASSKRQRHINRIKRFIRTAEKRGYNFPDNLKENLTTYSTQKLVSLTPQKLYEQATTEKFGIPMSGTRAREIERSLSAKKGAKTRKEKRGEEYIPKFTEIILSNVEAMIEEAISNPVYVGHQRTSAQNAESFKASLQEEYMSYDRDKVAMACEQAPDEIIVRARETIMASSSEVCVKHVIDLIQLIRGYIPTIDEAKSYETDYDNDIYIDDEE